MNIFKYLYFFLISSFVCLYSTPDVSIVGFILPQDGLGKVPIHICETLGSEVDANLFETSIKFNLKEELPFHTLNALNNPDQSPGKVAIYTDPICSLLGSNIRYVPTESSIKIAYSMFEANRIPNMWINVINETFDAVVVPDPYYVKVYKDSGVTLPIFVLPIPMRLQAYFDQPLHQFKSYPFTFGDASANKNPLILVEAFAQAFGNNRNIHLVLRAGSMVQETYNEIQLILRKHGLTNVSIQTQHLNFDQYLKRLSTFDCYVNLSCGEGFSFIPREALALGIPVIVTNNTASTTICNSGLVRSVISEKEIFPKYPLYEVLFKGDCGNQFDCEIEDAKEALLDVYNNYAEFLMKAHEGRNWVSQYDCSNPQLKNLYCTIVKPKKVVLGEVDMLEENVLTTTSKSLYEKYLKILNEM